MGSDNVFQENQEYLIKAKELVVAIDDMQDNLDQARSAQKNALCFFRSDICIAEHLTFRMADKGNGWFLR